MGYRIATFNIQKFGKISVLKNSEGNTKKDLNSIADIIRNNHFDIIAIQEISSHLALKELLEMISLQYAQKSPDDVLKRGNKEIETYSNLSSNNNAVFGYRTKHWEGRWAQPKSYYGGGNIQEGYAFIWNRDRIKLVSNSYGELFEPRIEDYGGTKLARPPFLGRFMPINGNFEIRLINTHIVYSKPSSYLDEHEDQGQEISKEDLSDIELRKNELFQLINTIYYRFARQVYDINRIDMYSKCLPHYTFLLGDYNLNLESSGGKSSARISRKPICVLNGGGMEVITVNDKLTTLKSKPRDPEIKAIMDRDRNVWSHLANNYDHFSYDIIHFQRDGIRCSVPEVILEFDRYAIDENDTNSRYDLYRERISDHVPVYLDFDIK